MQAAVSPVCRHITALWVAVGMLGSVGAHHASPALGVGFGQQQPLIGQPGQHVVSAVVGDVDGFKHTLDRAGRHVKGGADLF